jgi:hypothetical protein
MHQEPITLRPGGRSNDVRLDAEPTDVAVTIECDRCALDGTPACRGCLVSFVLDREPGDAVIIDADEARALRVLAEGGLVPASRFEASAS